MWLPSCLLGLLCEGWGSLVSWCEVQGEAGREGVCSRCQRLASTVCTSLSPAQSAGSLLLKCKGQRPNLSLRPRLLEIRRWGLWGRKAGLGVGEALNHLQKLPVSIHPFLGSRALLGCQRCWLDVFRCPVSSPSNLKPGESV